MSKTTDELLESIYLNENPELDYDGNIIHLPFGLIYERLTKAQSDLARQARLIDIEIAHIEKLCFGVDINETDTGVAVMTINLPIQVLCMIARFKSRNVTMADIIIEAVEDWLAKKS
jgi:hypothetical protein